MMCLTCSSVVNKSSDNLSSVQLTQDDSSDLGDDDPTGVDIGENRNNARRSYNICWAAVQMVILKGLSNKVLAVRLQYHQE
jgi:hypothetical protein